MSSKPWVVNASPLILLGKLDRLDLLECMAPSLHVPAGVIAEVSVGGRQRDPATTASVTWANGHRHADVPVLASVAAWDLGVGESQVISLCLQNAAIAVLDDGQARACARAHALPLIHQLMAEGSFLDKALVERELAKLGE